MTREQFNRKANDGTLTVGDVLRNRAYATAEQLAALTGGAVHLNPDVLANVAEVASFCAEVWDADEQGKAQAADLWDALAEGTGNPDS